MRRSVCLSSISSAGILFCVLVNLGCGIPNPDQQTTPVATGDGLTVAPKHEQELREAIDAMIAMIEGREHGQFLETYGDPKLVDDARAEGTLDDIAARIAGAEGDELLRVLKETRRMKPRFAPEDATATFWREGFPRYLVLRRIEGRWRIMN